MNKAVVKKSSRLGVLCAVLSLAMIYVFSDHANVNNEMLVKNVFDGIFMINYMLVLSCGILVVSMLVIICVNKMEGSSVRASLIERARYVLVISLLILVTALLLYFSMHFPVKEFEGWVKSIYWVNSILVSTMIGGFFVLIYILAVPSNQEHRSN